MTGTVLAVLALVVAAIVLRRLARAGGQRTAELASLEPTSIADLRDEATAVCAQLDRSALQRPCKVTGLGQPGPHPLTGPISGQPALWYEATVTHHFWKDHYSTDKHGNQQHRRTQHKEVLSTERSDDGALVLDDGTGQLRVALTAARLDGVRTLVDQMRPALSGSAGPVPTNTIGYSHTERAILPGDRLFVTGVLRAAASGPDYEVGAAGKGSLLVSTRTEDEVLTSRRRTVLAQNVGAGVLALTAAVTGVGAITEVFDDPAVAVAVADRTPAGDEPPATDAQPPRPLPVEPETETVAAAEAPAPPAEAAAPEPVAEPVPFGMPDLVGQDLQTAQNAVQTKGVFFSVSHDLRGARAQVLDANWRVCTQTPPAGTVIADPAAAEGSIDFGVVRVAETCP